MVDLVVVGGGLVGCAAAREAARRGMRVVVLERGVPGGEASGAAAGMLSAAVGAHEPGPFSDLLARCGRMYPEYVAALREETGLDVGYSAVGTLYLSLTEADDPVLEARYGWHSAAGLGTERLDASAARALEPAINPAVRWALRFPSDHQVDNRLLTRAAWLAAAGAGAEFRLGAEAAALVQEGGRVAGVSLASGEMVAADRVVLAAGAWVSLLGGLPRSMPVEPVRGQIVALESAPPSFRHVVDSARCYTVPRADGRLLVGSTAERAGYRKAVTAAGMRALLDAAVEIAPSLLEAPIVETWSGLRPWSADAMPILGPDPEVTGLFYATGHSPHGILLGPLTARMVVESLSGEAVDGLEPFSPARFTRPGTAGTPLQI